MSIYNTQAVNDAYELKKAADVAVNTAPKVLPPAIAEVVITEIRFTKESTWTPNRERLRKLINEINALAAAGQGSAA